MATTTPLITASRQFLIASFLAQRAIRRAGGNPSRLKGTGKGSDRFNATGRGAAVAAMLKNRNAWSRHGGVRTRSRRVAVKARVVKLNPQRGAAWGKLVVSAVDAHLRYLQRDGVTSDGEKGQVYSAGGTQIAGRTASRLAGRFTSLAVAQ
jgi:hypothetical protein